MIVFLHIPKTGGSTFQFILENNFGWSACHTNHAKKAVFGQADLDFARKLFPRLRSIAGHNLIDPLSLAIPYAFYVTFLRHPVERVISQYQNLLNHGRQCRTFEETLRKREQLQNLQVKLMAGEPNLDKAKRFLEQCGFVGVTEKFDLSLHVLGRLSPYRLNLNYKRRRVARDNSVRESLQRDSRIVDMIREYNRKAIELYRFGVEEIFPRLCAKAGLSPTEEAPSYDRYDTELKPKYLLAHLYNMLFYRQICKLLPTACLGCLMFAA
jgi:Sulfotransferase family